MCVCVWGLQGLQEHSSGRAKASQAAARKPRTWAGANKNTKYARCRHAKLKKANQAAGFEDFAECAWNGKTVRVSDEGRDECRVGRVTSATKRGDECKVRVTCGEEASNTILVDASGVELERPDWTHPAPDKLDYRVMGRERQTALAEDAGIVHTELIVQHGLLELGSVHALLLEVRARVQGVGGIVIVPPSLSVFLAGEGEILEPHMLQREWGERFEEMRREMHVYIVLHDGGPPRHYTLLELHGAPEARVVEYRDSLFPPSETARVSATRVLHKLGVERACPEPCNESFQEDGWSCGLWCARWIERSLRRLRGEGARPPASLPTAAARGNVFIDELQEARPARAARQPKAEAPAPQKQKKQIEPVHETFEAALAAGQKCGKCYLTVAGTKGCRECMGPWFENIRQRGFQ